MRRTALDGLRGLAALVVVFHHVLLTWPGWANAYLGSHGNALAYSPLHVVLDGTFAVYVFFVLSGYVLTLQSERLSRWRGYYGARLARLYLPVWGSVAFA